MFEAQASMDAAAEGSSTCTPGPRLPSTSREPNQQHAADACAGMVLDVCESGLLGAEAALGYARRVLATGEASALHAEVALAVAQQRVEGALQAMVVAEQLISGRHQQQLAQPPQPGLLASPKLPPHLPGAGRQCCPGPSSQQQQQLLVLQLQQLGGVLGPVAPAPGALPHRQAPAFLYEPHGAALTLIDEEDGSEEVVSAFWPHQPNGAW